VLMLRRARERHELLGGGGAAAPGSGGLTDASGMDSLLRERGHIQNSMNAAASAIGQAEAVRSDLHWQGRSLRSTGGVMGQIAGAVPGLNSLIDQIRKKRSRDDKIVAGVVASCILFTLWYLFG
jgi:golgi SNAP receptor complex member 1